MLVIGGSDMNGLKLASAERYDPEVWLVSQRRPDASGPGRESFGATELAHGRVLVVGGRRTGSSLYTSAE